MNKAAAQTAMTPGSSPASGVRAFGGGRPRAPRQHAPASDSEASVICPPNPNSYTRDHAQTGSFGAGHMLYEGGVHAIFATGRPVRVSGTESSTNPSETPQKATCTRRLWTADMNPRPAPCAARGIRPCHCQRGHVALRRFKHQRHLHPRRRRRQVPEW